MKLDIPNQGISIYQGFRLVNRMRFKSGNRERDPGIYGFGRIMRLECDIQVNIANGTSEQIEAELLAEVTKLQLIEHELGVNETKFAMAFLPLQESEDKRLYLAIRVVVEGVLF